MNDWLQQKLGMSVGGGKNPFIATKHIFTYVLLETNHPCDFPQKFKRVRSSCPSRCQHTRRRAKEGRSRCSSASTDTDCRSNLFAAVFIGKTSSFLFFYVMMRFVLWISIVILQLSAAQASNCTVIQNGGMTCYIIPNFKQTGCHYLWMNSSHHMLATHLNETHSLVVNKNATHLTTSVCIPVINYGRDCISEKFAFEVTCKVYCNTTADNLRRNLQQPGISKSSIALLVVITLIVLLLVLVGVGYFLYHKYRSSTSRN